MRIGHREAGKELGAASLLSGKREQVSERRRRKEGGKSLVEMKTLRENSYLTPGRSQGIVWTHN